MMKMARIDGSLVWLADIHQENNFLAQRESPLKRTRRNKSVLN
jgi:hypothetical protein